MEILSCTIRKPLLAPLSEHRVKPHFIWTSCRVRQTYGSDSDPTLSTTQSTSFTRCETSPQMDVVPCTTDTCQCNLGTTQSTSCQCNLGTTQSTSCQCNLGTTQSTSFQCNLGTTQSTSCQRNLGTTQSTSFQCNLGTTQSTSCQRNLGTTQSTSCETPLHMDIVLRTKDTRQRL